MSNERQEEMADISAELRDLSVSVTHVEPQTTVFGRPISDYFAELADRMESAAKRECEAVESDALAVGGIVAAARTAEKSSAVGNAAAMREALTKIHDLTNALDEECAVDPVEIRDIARAALSAPVRNCDRPECTASKNAQNVWHKEDGGKTAYYEWLLALAQERRGEGDGR